MAWPSWECRLPNDDKQNIQTSKRLIQVAACRLYLNRITGQQIFRGVFKFGLHEAQMSIGQFVIYATVDLIYGMQTNVTYALSEAPPKQRSATVSVVIVAF